MTTIPDCFACFKCKAIINSIKDGKITIADNHTQFHVMLKRKEDAEAGQEASRLLMSCCNTCFKSLKEDDHEAMYAHVKSQWEWEMELNDWPQEQIHRYKDFFWEMEVDEILEEVPHANA